MTSIAMPVAPVSAKSHAYRPDIDGLRALAVLSVVVFHAFPTLLSGGFVGVDIFFVISGYLISSVIVAKLEEGQFRFSDFYARRIRRIFPVLILVLLACLVVGWQVLLADEYAQLGTHMAAGAGFVSNLVLWTESGYFDNSADSKPLLHLWSLGIEEQFYIFWPFLMWVAHKAKLQFSLVVATVLLVSFALNIASVGEDQVSAFYMPYSRVWELLMGASLALVVRSGNAQRLFARVDHQHAAATLALLLLLFSMGALNKDSMFPGWWALLPTLGATVLISTGNSWVNVHILSHRLLVAIGLISYPLYLWHWPLLSFAHIIRNGEVSAGERLALVVLSVLLAFLSYSYWERYLRHQGAKVAMLLLLALMVLGLLGWNIRSRDGLDFRYWDIVSQPPEMVRDFTKWENKGMYPKGNCVPAFLYPNARICLQSKAEASPDTVVFGDSHAFHAYWGIARHFDNEQHTIKLVGRGGCSFFLYHNDGDCDQTFEQQANWMASDARVKNVFIVHRNAIRNGSFAEDIADYRKRLNSLLERLVRQNKQVIYLYTVPEDRFNPELCGSKLPFGRQANLSGCNFPLSREQDHQRTYRKLIADLLQTYPMVKVFDPGPVLCPDGQCQTVRLGKPIWMDNNHISESASYLQGEALARAIKLH
jgi:peptidoglycan/LPS O-acetylase OafA/YrhL